MNIARKAVCSAVLFAGLATGPVAHAATSGSAQITVSNITITLTDLDPDDGITPSFTLLSSPGATNFLYSEHVLYAGPDTENRQVLLGTTADNLSTAHAAGGVAASSSATQGVLHAAGSIEAADVQPTDYVYGAYAANAPGAARYAWGDVSYDGIYVYANGAGPAPSSFVKGTLTPNTRLEVTIHVDGQARATSSQELARNSQSAEAHLELASSQLHQWADPDDPDAWYDFVSLGHEQIGVSAASTYVETGEVSQESLDTDLRVSYDNVTPAGEALKLRHVDLAVYVQANGYATPAPEPATYALVGLGLGVAGWVARRRKTA